MNPFAFLLTSLFGSVFGAVNQYGQGKEAERIHRRNAQIIEQQGIRERKVARTQARERRKEGQRLKARQIVLYAKSGVSPAGGTPLGVTEESLRRIEEQASVIQEHGRYAFERSQSEAYLERQMGKSARRRGKYSAFASLATGLGRAGRDFYTYQDTKPKKKRIYRVH